eukprot:CAMPEP_0185836658 /NCGR_PEP_ID=MMETSP1353-20130828/10101_1 /TAXON_ID=1077150 /ORGANISM="Erythrolobus australicus, Strain CCMP3124" /LENGTH=172 /DNA_ID=CAMNT_0028535473 /DNA_START=269 /DNA_END=784 /DNA_ORIENTATION=+
MCGAASRWKRRDADQVTERSERAGLGHALLAQPRCASAGGVQAAEVLVGAQATQSGEVVAAGLLRPGENAEPRVLRSLARAKLLAQRVSLRKRAAAKNFCAARRGLLANLAPSGSRLRRAPLTLSSIKHLSRNLQTIAVPPPNHTPQRAARRACPPHSSPTCTLHDCWTAGP